MHVIDAVPHPSGDLPDLGLVTVPDPVPGQGNVVVQVGAAGVNPADILQRRGLYDPPDGAPKWLGLEVAGTISRIGAGVSGWAPGQRVAALIDGGGYAEAVVVPATHLLAIPSGLPMAEAAALPEALCTAWSNLVDVAQLKAGETVLIHGGSGGVGSIAIQLALALGARVITTAGGPERAARCAELAAEVDRANLTVVDYRAADFSESVAEATGGRGADVILDVVGAAYLAKNIASLAIGGRLVVIGMQKGARAELDLGALLARRASIHGTTLRARPAAEKAAIVSAVRERAWPLVASGRIRPIVHAQLPLSEAARAHDLIIAREVFGKLVLIP